MDREPSGPVGLPYDYTIAVRKAAGQSSLTHRGERTIKIITVAIVLACFLAAFASGKMHFYYSLFSHSKVASLFWWTALLFGGVTYAALVWRVLLWRRYRPMPAPRDEELPNLTVIIPAFNEGPLVRQSILSVAANDYPADKLEIIAVDDGSTDDTWHHIQAAASRVSRDIRLTTLQQTRNKGKREALYLGFKRGTGDIFVTLDSDSILSRDALRNGVAPLVREKKIGNVAGCVEVLNPRESWVTRFLKCTFSLSFKFVRAYQSEFRGVFCTPGALSFFRADAVRKVADEWLRQQFLGVQCTIGEDRAMTNLMLRDGWLTAYQGNAKVYSKMPTTYGGMCKMLLRWGRSNIRETVVLLRFLFTRFRSNYLRSFQFNMLLTIVSLFLPPLFILNGYVLMLTNFDYAMHAMGLVMINGAFMSLIYYMNEKDSDWVWLFAYEYFWTAALSWIIPWAAMTVRNAGWLTRGNAKPVVPRPVTVSTPVLTSGESPVLRPALASPSR
jgi:hyaluronan synthase